MSRFLVSVLVPTKNRTGLLARSVKSLIDNCADASQIEIVVAYDEDDLTTKNYLSSDAWQVLTQSTNITTCLCPSWGYSGLNRYYTTMAQQSQAAWFMIWNDDAVMLTPQWDIHLEQHKDFVGMLHMVTENFKPSLCLFPLIPRIWLELFGEISQHQLNDSWIQDICTQANAVRSIPVTVFHDRYDVTGNNLDDTYKKRRYDKKIYNHESMQKIRADWSRRLIEYREQIAACEPKPGLI